MWKIIAFVSAVMALLALGIWLSWPRSPQDLRIAGIKVIRQMDIPRADEPSPASEPLLPIAVVRLETSSDLARLASNFLYEGLYARYFLCRSGTTISEGTNLVFDESGRISFGANDGQGSTAKTYHVYLALRSIGIPGFGKYDLLKNQEDVCLVLVPESPEFGSGPRTNVVRITRKSLKDALAGPSR